MTTHEAETFVLMLRTAFSNERWDGPTIQFWVTHFERLEVPEIAYAVVEKVIEEEQRRPAWAVIRQAYRVEFGRRSEEAARSRGIGDGRDFGRPTWTYVHTWARFYRDPPVDADHRFPQSDWFPPGTTRLTNGEIEHSPEVDPQRLAKEGREITFMDDEEYDRLHAEWLDAGAPRLHNPVLGL